MTNKKKFSNAELELPGIINKPQLQYRWQRGLFAAVSILVWLLWFYLFVPVLTMIAWLLNLHIFSHMLAGEVALRSKTLLEYSWIIGTLGSVLLIWALYNYLRFKGQNKRSPPAPLRVENLSRSFHLMPEEVQQLQKAQVVHLWHDGKGGIDHFVVDKL